MMKLVSALVTFFPAFSVAFCASRGLVSRFGTGTSLSAEATDSLGLTPELAKITEAFEAIGDDKLRYKQLLFMANQLQPMDPTGMTPENKVPGCLSTVYVDGKLQVNEAGENVVVFTGDSDGLLTKGLVALLVRGLSGNSVEAIQKVDPAFIKKAGISTSLTPGRNNGFLNMLSTMKKKAAQLETSGESSASGDAGDSSDAVSETPVYDEMLEALQKLQPTSLSLTDVSYKHEGHAGAKGIEGGESHFELEIVSPAFEGLNLVKRHQMVYMILGNVMPKIHALAIKANTPDEVKN
jgi:sulfur transfer protein SufE/stress-induced morphogen